MTADFLAEVGEMLLAQAPFQVGARIHTGRRMRLEVDEIAIGAIGGRCAEEVIEAHLEQIRRRRGARDMTAQFAVRVFNSR